MELELIKKPDVDSRQEAGFTGWWEVRIAGVDGKDGNLFRFMSTPDGQIWATMSGMGHSYQPLNGADPEAVERFKAAMLANRQDLAS